MFDNIRRYRTELTVFLCIVGHRLSGPLVQPSATIMRSLLINPAIAWSHFFYSKTKERKRTKLLTTHQSKID